MASKGILGTKLGMTQVFDEEAKVVPVTVIQAGPCTVTQVKTVENDGYNALQMAYGSRRKQNKPIKGHLEKAGVASARTLGEIRTDDLVELGARITAGVFTRGELVDVTGTSKGKGFAGVMKRHNFAGMGDGHGVKKKNRHPGAVGACATPGRTFPGQRMAGRMGHKQVTIQNLEVVDVDTERDLLLIKGAVPGHDGSIVVIRSAVKGPEVPGFTESLERVIAEQSEAGPADEVEVDEDTAGQEAAAEPEASAQADTVPAEDTAPEEAAEDTAPDEAAEDDADGDDEEQGGDA